MLKKHTYDIADRMGIQLSEVTIIEGRNVGCLDTHLLNMKTNGRLASALVNQAELDEVEKGVFGTRLEMKIYKALLNLELCRE